MPSVQRRTGLPGRVRPRRDIGGVFFDVLAVLAVLVLAGLSALNLLAIGGRSLAVHQLAAVAGGLVLLLVLRLVRGRLLSLIGWVCYCVAVVLLVAVLVAGLNAYGAQRWLAFGSLRFQPSELAKLGLLLVLANVLGSSRAPWRRFALAVLLAVVPITLTVLQPDLSTAMLLIALTVGLLVLGRVPARFLLPLFTGAVVVTPLAVGLLRPYQLNRLHAFLSGSHAASGPGWAALQAHIALAAGGWFGLSHQPLHLLAAEYLPGRETDLALSSLVEERGLVAGAAAILAALALLWRVALASRAPRSRNASLFASGLAVLFGVEVVLSVGGNLGLLPLAGVPFPLLSYGGTAAAVHVAALGLVLGNRRDGVRRRLWSAPHWVSPRPRLVRLVALALSGVLLILTWSGWRLQDTQATSLSGVRVAQMTRCFALPAPRGSITDRHGIVLARDVARDGIEAIPAVVLHRPGELARLAGLLRQPDVRLRRTVTEAGGALSVRVAAVPADVGSRIIVARLPGVLVVPSALRSYPYGPLLAPVLGFVGVATPPDVQRWAGLSSGEIVGRAGIEEQYDPLLRGVDGRQCVYVSPAGIPVALGAHRASLPGSNLRLSIDLGLQERLTAELAAAMGSGPGRRGDLGAAVAMDPRDGQVLAMASVPSYDDNLYGPPVRAAELARAESAPGSPMLEHVTQAVAPPGSTFKLVVGSADVATGVLPPDAVIPTGGSFTLAGHTFHNWGDLPPQDLVQAIAWSNDVYFYRLAWALGADRLHRIGTELGVGQPTGIDLPGESSGYFGDPRSVAEAGGRWYAGSTIIMGIGQGYLDVTPLQDARWTAAVTTGRLTTPRLGLSFGGAGGYTPLPAANAAQLPFAEQLGPVRQGMRQAVTGGTATVLNDLPGAVGAKTGTAEDAASPGGRTDSWMTAVAPLANPAVVITALLRGAGEGAATSGPVVDHALRYFLAHQGQILARAPRR